ncbi:hypothetical protein LCGC14_2394190 [marine sediment metagenome]|uniref:Uncharacterized protein n=1 Tax=marine sediment metagenome TaxID=412755 RepID=A0A0F9ERQ8_9ZZZZ
MERLQPKDVIALATLLLVGVLKYNGINGELDTVAALILGYYFAHRKNGSDNGH